MKKIALSNEEIKRNIKVLAGERGLSMVDISRQMGRTKSFLASTFSKNQRLVSLDTLKSVAEVLDCKICDLIGGK